MHSDRDAICREFGNGAACSRRDGWISENPHRPSQEPELWAAWNAGWLEEEGPVYRLNANVSQVGQNA